MITDMGDSMEIQFWDKTSSISRTFAVSFSLNIYDEKDKSKNCWQYPNKYFHSFQQCDDLRTKEFLKSKGLNPIWAADPYQNITENNVVSNHEDYSIIANYVKGITETDCKHPCNTLSTTTRYNGRSFNLDEDNYS